MNKNTKIFRIGHRSPRKQGVITIASEVYPETGEIFYGSSFCHPKEKKYDKKFGIDQSLSRLQDAIQNDDSLKLYEEVSHSAVLNTILSNLYFDTTRPKWATDIIVEQLNYPTGLKRYSRKSTNDDNENEINFGISSITVKSEFAKEQLIMALQYIDNLEILDDGFIAISRLLDAGYNQDLIKVE